MPTRDDLVRLRHMLDAARKAQQFVRGRPRVAVERDETLTLALVRLLEIIGEAAKRVSAETRARYPGIPWKEIGGTRDRDSRIFRCRLEHPLEYPDGRSAAARY